MSVTKSDSIKILQKYIPKNFIPPPLESWNDRSILQVCQFANLTNKREGIILLN